MAPTQIAPVSRRSFYNYFPSVKIRLARNEFPTMIGLMPAKKRKFADFEAMMVKLSSEYPAEIHEPDEIAIVVIKSHLLAENYLDAILELAANDPEKLALDENIGFAAKARLVRAFTSFGDDDRWPIVDGLNILEIR